VFAEILVGRSENPEALVGHGEKSAFLGADHRKFSLFLA
jgi:hypothetical protein